MRVEKEYRQLEGIEEIRIFNASQKDFYKPVLKKFVFLMLVKRIFINPPLRSLMLKIWNFKNS